MLRYYFFKKTNHIKLPFIHIKNLEAHQQFPSGTFRQNCICNILSESIMSIQADLHTPATFSLFCQFIQYKWKHTIPDVFQLVCPLNCLKNHPISICACVCVRDSFQKLQLILHHIRMCFIISLTRTTNGQQIKRGDILIAVHTSCES